MVDTEKQFGKALAVDDEPSILRAISRILRASCGTVETLDSTNVPIAGLIDQIRGKLSHNLLLTLDGQYNGGTADRVSASFSQVSVLEKPFGIEEFSSAASALKPVLLRYIRVRTRS